MDINDLFIINNLPKPLPNKEVNKLFEELQNGNLKAKDIIVEHNLKLVLNQVFKRFNTVEHDKKELVSIGIEGLIKAVDTFDVKKEVKFVSYATRCIDNQILMFIRQNKKHENVDDLDGSVYSDKDGNELSLGDVIPCDINIENNYVDNELYQFIRTKYEELQGRNKEIIKLYFGFNCNRQTQQEIADKMGISRSYVSRIIGKIVDQLANQLEEKGFIEKRKEKNKSKSKFKSLDNQTKKEGTTNMAKKLQSIYEYFNAYSKKEVDIMISKLDSEEKKLLTLRYGEDLENPVTSPEWDKKMNSKFYYVLLPKMKKMLTNPNYVPRKRKQLLNAESSSNIESPKTEQKEKVEVKTNNEENNEKREETQSIININEMQNTNIEEQLILLQLLKTSNFKKLLNLYSPIESIIVSLKLGYIKDKHFSTEEIAEFLKVDSEEVINITRKVLLDYKEQINKTMDKLINSVIEEDITKSQIKSLNKDSH